MELSEDLIRTRMVTNINLFNITVTTIKNNFANRVITIWNSLSNYVSFCRLTCLNRLHNFSSNQEVGLYCIITKADLHGIGNHST